MQGIMPCLWFDQQAEEAAHFYVSLFKNSAVGLTFPYNEDVAKVAGRPAGSVMTVDFQLEGQDFIALNGNDRESFTPAISFMVGCETVDELDTLWNALVDGGSVLMALGKYPFSEKYGWLQDKYGVYWQLILGQRSQKISPCLLFVGKKAGKAEEAMKFYTSLFPNSSITALERYAADEGPDAGRVKYGTFSLNGQSFVAMDSGMPEHAFTFTSAVSLMVLCDTQAEIDRFWDGLSAEGEEIVCGWVNGPYGVTWQITPVMLMDIRNDPDSRKYWRAMQALMDMKKLDIARLKQAAERTLV